MIKVQHVHVHSRPYLRNAMWRKRVTRKHIAKVAPVVVQIQVEARLATKTVKEL